MDTWQCLSIGGTVHVLTFFYFLSRDLNNIHYCCQQNAKNIIEHTHLNADKFVIYVDTFELRQHLPPILNSVK